MSGFDDLPEDEPKKAPVRKPAAKAAVVGSDDGKVVLTIKGGSGFDAPWIVIHANDIEDAHSHLHGDNATLLVEVMEALQKASVKFVELGGGKKATVAPGGAPSGANEAPPGVSPAPGPDWQYKTGVNGKTGKTWRAWMPPRGSDASPVWL